jgi:uncharacterized protein (DUF1015 family)
LYDFISSLFALLTTGCSSDVVNDLNVELHVMDKDWKKKVTFVGGVRKSLAELVAAQSQQGWTIAFSMLTRDEIVELTCDS